MPLSVSASRSASTVWRCECLSAYLACLSGPGGRQGLSLSQLPVGLRKASKNRHQCRCIRKHCCSHIRTGPCQYVIQLTKPSSGPSTVHANAVAIMLASKLLSCRAGGGAVCCRPKGWKGVCDQVVPAAGGFRGRGGPLRCLLPLPPHSPLPYTHVSPN